MSLTDPGNTGREGFVEHLNLQVRNDKEVRGVLRETDRFVQQEISQIGGNSFSEQVRRAQYQQVKDSIAAQTDAGWSEIGRVIDGNIGRSAAIAGDGAADLVAALGTALPDELLAGMQAAAETSGQRVAARLSNQIELSPRVYDNAALTRGHIDQIINVHIASNSSARELAKAVSSYISPSAPGGMSYCAMRLGRTELNNAFHNTNRAMYRSQPWVDGVKWLLSGSHPKPDICNEFADASPYTPLEVPGKPHPQCLCYTVPVTPSREEFMSSLLDGDYDDWLEENGLTPISEDVPMMEKIYKITKEDLIRAREEGKSWAVIAKEFDLGSPGSARTAWTRLTGTPHTTAPSAVRTTATKAVPKAPTPKPTPAPTKAVESAAKRTTTRRTEKHLAEWVDKQTTREVEQQLNAIMDSVKDVHKVTNGLHPNFNSTLEGMDIKVANRVAKETRDFVDEFPAVRRRLTGIRVESTGEDTIMATADPRDGVVRLNPKYWGNGIKEDALASRQSSMKITGFKSTGDPYHTINHELGHMVDFVAETQNHVDRSYSIRQALVNNTSLDGDTAQVFSFNRGTYGRDLAAKETIGRHISTYGASNSYEFVAESFADVRINGAAARKISRDTVRDIYDVAKKKGRR